MSAAVPLRDDFDAPTLRRLSRTCGDNRQIRRLLALSALYDGMKRSEAARNWWHGSTDAARLGASLQ